VDYFAQKVLGIESTVLTNAVLKHWGYECPAIIPYLLSPSDHPPSSRNLDPPKKPVKPASCRNPEQRQERFPPCAPGAAAKNRAKKYTGKIVEDSKIWSPQLL
jgi:hypothetical protein